MDNTNGSVRPQQSPASDGLSVRIRWPQTQDEPIAAAKPVVIPAERSSGGPQGQVVVDRVDPVPPGRDPHIARLVVSVAEIAARVEALSASEDAFRTVVHQRLSEQQEDDNRRTASVLASIARSSPAGEPRIATLVEQVGLLCEAQVAQTRSLQGLVARQEELATEVRGALAGVQEELRLLKRRLALRGRVDGELDDGAVRAVADAVVAGLEARPRRGPTRPS